MNILLVNPPNCGRSIPEERFGITTIKQIFRGEPLALEELAGNLAEHEVAIVDLKADPNNLDDVLSSYLPDLVGITGVTCEANTMLRLAARVKERSRATVVVGGIHASNDPQFFNHQDIDYIVTGLGKRRFAELVASLENSDDHPPLPNGVYRSCPGTALRGRVAPCDQRDLVADRPPAYHLVARYRNHYRLEKLGVTMGFVASAFGCTHRCSFCCIGGQTGGRYLMKPVTEVVREIDLLRETPVIRLVDANTFGDTNRATALAQALIDSNMRHQYLADIRADTVVRNPELLQLWKKAGLRAVVIGFEDITDAGLRSMNKASSARANSEAVCLLGELGITIVGDFIISPDYGEDDFDRLADYLTNQAIDLPMITVMTPLPGTPLYHQQRDRIINHDLDFYTLTNAVTRTRLPEERFYERYAHLIATSHEHARL